MTKHSTGLALNDAPSQYDRRLRSVEPDSVRVDQRTHAELLSFAARFGPLVRFYDLKNKPDGDWTLFFLTDPTIVLASVATLDLHEIEQYLRQLPNTADDSQHNSIQAVLTAVRSINDWLTSAQMDPQSRVARLFSREIIFWVETCLAGPLGKMKTHAEVLHQHHPHHSFDFTGLHSSWGFHHNHHHEEPRHPERDNFDFEQLYQTLLLAFRQIKEFAHRHLAETLEEPNHRPQIALWITFAHLFEYAQRSINTLTPRFKNFYYTDVLRGVPDGAIADSVYLTFALDPTLAVPSATVPAGTQFPAGKEPDGSPLLYATSKDLEVSTATLARVSALRQISGPLFTPAARQSPEISSPPTSSSLQLLLTTEIDVATMNAEAAGKGPATGPLAWPTFGESTLTTDAISASAPAILGFAIASPYLMLTGGDRTLTLTFQLSPSSAQTLNDSLESLAAATGLEPTTVLEQVVAKAFDIYLSTATGWFLVNAYTCLASQHSSPGGIDSFSLTVELASSAPAIVNFNPTPDELQKNTPQPDALNPAPTQPTAKLYLRQSALLLHGLYDDVTVYPLSLLAEAEIEVIDIHTVTLDLTNLQAQNSTGPVDPKSPFSMFGATPVTGSFLQCTNPELFVKTPDSGSLSLKLTWFGLPPNSDGFTGYYAGYVLGLNGEESETALFTNRSFQSNLEVINPGTWQLDAQADGSGSPPSPPNSFLFRTQPELEDGSPSANGTLSPLTVFDGLELYTTPAPPSYDPNASALRLTLTEPPYAFGNLLYSANVMNAVLKDVPKTFAAATADPGCQPLATAATSLDALLKPPTTSSSTNATSFRDLVYTTVAKTQGALIESAQSYLDQIAAQYGRPAITWVQQTFAVSGSSAPPYVAQKVSARLQAAYEALAAQAVSSTAPPLSAGAANALQHALQMLQAVIALQQALDNCAADPSDKYEKSATAQLTTCQQTLQKAFASCGQSDQLFLYPNPPWYPMAQSLSLSYTASCSFAPARQNGKSQFFYLGPSGGYNQPDSPTADTLLLPIPQPGELQLGFSSLDAQQDLDLLLQMSAGSFHTKQPLTWQYLSANTWTSFAPTQLIADTTNGLQNTGILTLGVPSGDITQQTLASSSYRWLRAITTGPAAFPDMIGVYPHPGIATWVSDAGGSGEHLNQPLPPYTITTSVQKLGAVKTIQQPIESFGGRPAEDEPAFQTRQAELLRHKNRAILPWDYESLVLQRFPTIWKVQALPATQATVDDSPGSVLVVVVAGQQGLQAVDPTQPLVPSEMLGDIHDYLVSLSSPFASINVVNPIYVQIEVHAKVVFQDAAGVDSASGGGIDGLNADLIQYLSPWFYDAERAALRGNYASRDAITQFIQSRPYVESLIDIQLTHTPHPASLSWYFLTSAPAHVIKAYTS